jgi:uncharacterized protein YjbJ (UPF0337 family)
MNKDKVEGSMKDIKGRVERQVGEWTGDTDAQIKGTADQAEGKIQKGVGKVKDAGKKLADDMRKNARDEDVQPVDPSRRKTA